MVHSVMQLLYTEPCIEPSFGRREKPKTPSHLYGSDGLNEWKKNFLNAISGLETAACPVMRHRVIQLLYTGPCIEPSFGRREKLKTPL